MSVAIIHHADCWDGIAAAMIVELALSYIPEHRTDEAPVWYPCHHDKTTMASAILAKVKAKGHRQVYIVDFSFSREAITDLAASVESVVVIDHHKTAQATLECWKDKPANVTTVFDMSLSAASLVTKHFSSRFRPSWDTLDLIAYIGDRDLWQFQLAKTRDVCAYLSLFPFTREGFIDAVREFTENRCAVIESGEAVRRCQESFVKYHIERVTPCVIRHKGRDMLGMQVNATILQSEIGDAILRTYPLASVAVIYRTNECGSVVYSLRSRPGEVDVSEIAKARGGGGHACAAGYTVAQVGGKGFMVDFTVDDVVPMKEG